MSEQGILEKKILFPTDYSESSHAALAYAVALARQAGALLEIVHVAPQAAGGADSPGPERPESAEWAQLLTAVTANDAQPVAHRFRTVHGDPAAEIVRLAGEEQAEMIVMATAGRTGLRRLVMGSVAEAVVRCAACPVLTIRASVARRAASSIAGSTSQGLSADNDSQWAEGMHEQTRGTVADETSLAAATLVERAIDSRATDIHIDPFEGSTDVRFRIDGDLIRYCRLAPDVARPLVTQLKVMADIDIADPFHPHEGRLTFPRGSRMYEARLTTVPVVGGESIAVRLLDRERLLRPLDTLGLSARSLERIHEMLSLGEGVVLVTGPAGSGKTTTAYSMVHAVDDGRHNIVTIEDPPEYRVPSFRQMAVDTRHNVTMTTGLRNLLRMDPDIVLVGEIRDAETAEIVMRAASSGKYVFTTLHTRDVASTITAMHDLHIDNRSLAGNLTGIISQRLVRRLCTHCRHEVPVDSAQAECFSAEGIEPPSLLYSARGCTKCRGFGYFERVGIFEVVVPTRAIREAIERGAPEGEVRDMLRAEDTRSLLADGLEKSREGTTTLEEIRSMTWVHFPPPRT